MKAYVVYDSAFGNTKRIAEAIAQSLEGYEDIELLHISKLILKDFHDVDLLVIGSPTQGGRATQAIINFMDGMTPSAFDNLSIATFDTRMAIDAHGRGLHLLMRTIGFAAPKLERELLSRGAIPIVEPEGFIVTDKEGPLLEGELERAQEWAQHISHAALKLSPA